MKFSTTFTLATLALMSIGTHARIGKDQHRQLFEGIGCCKVNDIDNCEQTFSRTVGCKQIGDTGLSCFDDNSPERLKSASCCTQVDRGTYWVLGGCK